VTTADLALQQQLHHFYREHHGWLQAWLRRKTGCPQQAFDLAQNTFVRALGLRDALSALEQPRAWLSTTAKRLLIDDLRRQRIEQAYLEALAGVVDEAGYPSPEQTLAAVQALQQFCAVLEAVPPKARQAFVRHYLDEAPQALVAEELGVSLRMVQKYLAQVLLAAAQQGLAL